MRSPAPSQRLTCFWGCRPALRQVTDEQIDRMMRMADLDDSGSIDFREFQVGGPGGGGVLGRLSHVEASVKEAGRRDLAYAGGW